MVFSRRMLGDEFCQKVFYLVCTFIWLANKVEISLKEYQDALIEDVFGYWDTKGFIQTLKISTEVMISISVEDILRYHSLSQKK